MINEAAHPARFLQMYLAQHPEIFEIELSAYQYVPDTVRDERQVFHVPSNGFEAAFLNLKSKLRPHTDIAFHSRVHVRVGDSIEIRHIPLIDMHVSELSPVSEALRALTREIGWKRTAIYASGRSFHVYGFELLSMSEWIRFMGRLLLLNRPGLSDLVDARWVGHRLMAGYAALRWTSNHPRYMAEPKLVDLW